MNGSTSDTRRWSHVEVDLAAISHNVELLASKVAPAQMMAVVKADGYGHGAVPVARTALRAGAQSLAVALVQEGIELRRAGIEAPILVLSEQPESQIADMVSYGLTATAYSLPSIDALERAARNLDVTGYEVHLKIDTGMNRVGVRSQDVSDIAQRIVAGAPWLSLGGTYTHFAAADDLGSTSAGEQLAAFDALLDELGRAGIDVGTVHTANSAASLVLPGSRRDVVRIGIAMYGITPSSDLVGSCEGLRPALSLKSRVSHVKDVRAGEGVSYGAHYRCATDTSIATVPIGYADGVARRAGLAGVQVLIDGRRHPIVGVVTMDQLMVDVGSSGVSVGDEVVLIGAQGDECIRVENVATLLGTIGYEVVCSLSARLPRVYVDGET